MQINKKLGHLFLAASVTFAALFLLIQNKAERLQSSDSLSEDYKQNKGNRNVESFQEAKKILRKLYSAHQIDFYCGCSFSNNVINLTSCGYIPVKSRSRAHRLEWEHIVPSYNFGHSFTSWREGHSDCVDRQGRSFKGRNCARLVSATFRKMEGDLFNIVPVIGEINGLRSNYPMGILAPGSPNTFGTCMTKILDHTIEPRPEIRGFVARVYKYMEYAYPGHGIISRKNSKLFEAWDNLYPPDEFELWRAQQIEKIQGNKNPMIIARTLSQN